MTFTRFLFATATLPYLLLLFAAAGGFIAIEDALEGALAAELLPAAPRRLGYGVLGSINGIGDRVSSPIVGPLWNR